MYRRISAFFLVLTMLIHIASAEGNAHSEWVGVLATLTGESKLVVQKQSDSIAEQSQGNANEEKEALTISAEENKESAVLVSENNFASDAAVKVPIKAGQSVDESFIPHAEGKTATQAAIEPEELFRSRFRNRGSGNNVSYLVTISDGGLYKDGMKVNGSTVIHVNDRLQWNYRWNVSPENTRNISSGDYFQVTLNGVNAEYFTATSLANRGIYKDGVRIGIFSVSGNIAKITFTEGIQSAYSIDDGFMQVEFRAAKESATTIYQDGGSTPIQVTILPGDPNADVSNGLATGEDFYKYGDEKAGYIRWTFRVNQANLERMISTRSRIVTPKAWIEDILPAELDMEDITRTDVQTAWGTEYVDKRVYIGTVISKLRWDGSTEVLDDAFRYPGFDIGYQEWVKQNPGESYSDFKSRVLSMQPFTVGIYKTNKTYVIINLGDIPSNHLTYYQMLEREAGLPGVSGAQLLEVGMNDSGLTEDQKQRVRYIYGPNGPSNGKVMSYNIDFYTKPKNGKGEYRNTATLNWGTNGSKDQAVTINYQGSDAGFDITPKTSVEVQKYWVGTPAKSLTVRLHRKKNNQPGSIFKTKELTSADSVGTYWNYTFTGLPKKDTDGAAFIYWITEESPPGYQAASPLEISSNVWVLRNTRETTSYQITKKWRGEPAEVTIDLMQDGVKYDSVTWRKSDFGSGKLEQKIHTFSDLPKTRPDGKPYVYSAEEKQIDGYRKEEKNSSNEKVFTNIQVKNFVLTKKWLGIRAESQPDSIDVTMDTYQGNKKMQSEIITLRKNEGWTKEITKDVYDEQGKELSYRFSEPVPANANYVPKVTENGNNIAIYNIRKMSIRVRKNWIKQDADKFFFYQKQGITLQLAIKKNGLTTEKPRKSVTWTKEDFGDKDSLEHTFEDLEMYDEDGNPIDYDVIEKPLTGESLIGFRSEKSWDPTNKIGDLLTCTISNAPEYREVEFTKKYIGVPLETSIKLIQSRIRPGQERETLKEQAYQLEPNVFRDLGNNISQVRHTFRFPKFDELGNELDYNIEETGFNKNFELLSKSGNFNQNHEFVNRRLHKFTVTKKWLGKPTDITLNLIGKANGKVVVNKSELWSKESFDTSGGQYSFDYTFDSLPQYTENGDLIAYELTEEIPGGNNVPKYHTDIKREAFGRFIITNTEQISIPVEKIWIGKPSTESIRLQLHQVNENNVGTTLVDEIVLPPSVATTWTGVFRKVPRYRFKQDGSREEIEYYVDEVLSVKEAMKYQVGMSKWKDENDKRKGFVISNIEKGTPHPPVHTIPEPKVPQDNPPSKPPTPVPPIPVPPIPVTPRIVQPPNLKDIPDTSDLPTSAKPPLKRVAIKEPLPQTSGIPADVFYGIGFALALLGFKFRIKKRKSRDA